MSAQPESWQDESFRVPEREPHIEPGRYYARTKRPRRVESYGRQQIILPMSIRAGQVPDPSKDPLDPLAWREIAELPYWCRYPGRGRPPAANSNLGILLTVIYAPTGSVRPDRVSYKNLEGKLLWVEVGDKVRKTEGGFFIEATRASVVRAVLARVA